MLPIAGGGTPAAVGDGAIGAITHDANHQDDPKDKIIHSKFQATTAGPVNYAHIYIDNANTDNICLSIWNASGTKLASCSAYVNTNTAGWQDCQLDQEVNLAAATDYYIGVNNDSVSATNYGIYYTATNNAWEQEVTYSCGQNVNAEDTDWPGDRQLVIYFNNSADDPN